MRLNFVMMAFLMSKIFRLSPKLATVLDFLYEVGGRVKIPPTHEFFHGAFMCTTLFNHPLFKKRAALHSLEITNSIIYPFLNTPLIANKLILCPKFFCIHQLHFCRIFFRNPHTSPQHTYRLAISHPPVTI